MPSSRASRRESSAGVPSGGTNSAKSMSRSRSMSTSSHYNSSSDFQQQQQEQEQLKNVPIIETPTFIGGGGDITPSAASTNKHFAFPEVAPIHQSEAASASAATSGDGGADMRNQALTDADVAVATNTNGITYQYPASAPSKRSNPNHLAKSSSHSPHSSIGNDMPIPQPVLKKSSSSARKVLQVAGRPLRSVGRRLTGRFKQQKRQSETYGSVDSLNNTNNRGNGVGDEGLGIGNSRAGSSSTDDIASQKIQTRSSFVDSLRQAIASPKLGVGGLSSIRTLEGGAVGATATTSGLSLDAGVRGATAAARYGNDRDWIVNVLERHLRHVCLLLGAYMIGVYIPAYIGLVHKLAEYSVVALVTCWVILTAAACQSRFRSVASTAATGQQIHSRSYQNQPLLLQKQQQRRQHQLQYEHDDDDLDVESDQRYYGYGEEELLGEGLLEDSGVAGAMSGERRPLLLRGASSEGNDGSIESTTTPVDLEAPGNASAAYGVDGLLLEDSTKTPEVDILPAAETVVHPALEPFFVLDCATGIRIYPNAIAAYPLDTDYFTGTMMILIRTPDVDDPFAVRTEENAVTTKYFTGKQRRFEFQFQLRLKKVPTGRVYFACELEESFKMGMIQRAFVGAAMAFVRTTNSSFHYSMTGNPESPDGRYENPHMAFPVEGSMDRLVATLAGEPVPTLGGPIYEDPESLKRRKKGGLVDWNTTDTYTMALWSAYVDFLDWRCLNLPGIRPFDLCSVIGRQPIILTLYDLPDDRESDKHYRRDMTNIVRIEMGNASKFDLGPMARQWSATHQGAGLSTKDTTHQQDEDFELAEIQEESDNDEATLEELGEGIYVRSGDSITLRESVVDEDGEANGQSCYVTIGAGFAILQDRQSANIIIEKVEKSRSGRKSPRSKLIKNGDTVMFKLVTKGRNSKSEEFVETRYLTLHRGWWLKWVGMAPTKNGYFTIRTHETDFSEADGVELGNNETQSSYLSLGGSFWLQHKRWKECLVGVAVEGSATYGGRILGLYKPKTGPNEPNDDEHNDQSDCEMRDPDQPEGGERDKSEWMVPLQLRAYECVNTSLGTGAPSDEVFDDNVHVKGKPRLLFSREDHRMDVPAWLEIMNRTERIRQLTYVVRVIPPASSFEHYNQEDDDEDHACTDAFMRLRTGRDLAPAMRTGLNWRNSTNGTTSPRGRSLTMPESDAPSTPSPRRRRNTSSDKDSAYIFFEGDGTGVEPKVGESSDDVSEVDSVDELDAQVFEDIDDLDTTADVADNRSKSRKFIGKIAKSVKTRTSSTGKTMVRQSVKVGKGTVNAGKAISRIAPIRPKIPKSIEPKSAKETARSSRRRREQDLRVAGTRSMKGIERFDSMCTFPDSPNMLAGQLSAPEQSCRTVSTMLSCMSDLPRSSTLLTSFSALLSEQVELVSDQDRDFLQGGAIEVGVVPSKGDLSKGLLVSECLVARCLWESHWREEWCGVYQRGLEFYAPLSRSPCLELSFADVQSVRFLNSDVRSPLPGYPILVIETAWLCHYAAFADLGARESFRTQIEGAMAQFANLSDPTLAGREKELWKARFWQGFQNSIEASLSSGKGKWAEIASGTKKKRRTIINNRRMVFDLEPELGFVNDFVEDLLSTCLSFSLNSLEEHPEALLKFIDATSKLRILSFQQIDPTSESTFCMFVNLYHCLLQHALLLSLNGPLHKKSFGHFMQTSCYEIGGDVFSLAEIYSCIIRGNMTRPIGPRPPYIDVSKKSNAYRHYALSHTSRPCINFLLNTADTSCPRDVHVLRPDHLEVQMILSAAEFLTHNVALDETKRIIFIPKLCEVYRNDFAGDSVGAANICLQYCLRYIPEPMRTKITNFLEEEPSVTIKYFPTAEHYHASLRLAEDDNGLEDIPIISIM